MSGQRNEPERSDAVGTGEAPPEPLHEFQGHPEDPGLTLESVDERTDFHRGDGIQTPASVVIPLAVVAGLTIGMFLVEGRELQGGLALALMLAFLLIRVPVGAAMGLAGLLGILALGGPTVASRTLIQLPFNAVSGWSLSVLPMFILMGLLLWRAGATGRVYDGARVWLGWLPGGLAMTTNAAGAGLAAASGSTIGITYAVGRIGIPEMLQSGYDKRLAAGSVLMAGTGGQLIPPSILLVVYAGIVEVPIGRQLLAGFLPGLLLTGSYALLIFLIALARPGMAPRDNRLGHISWLDRFRIGGRAWPVPVLTVVVVGGLYSGVFTATEAGAVGAMLALVTAILFLRGRDLLSGVKMAMIETVASVGSIFFLLVGAAFLNRLIALSGLGARSAQAIDSLGLTLIQFMLVMIIVYLVLGMFMEPVAMILITLPILLPTLQTLEINLIWFGIFVVLLGELSILTPPVGILSFVVYKICQEPQVNLGQTIKISDVFTAALWFIPVSLLVLLAIIFFPDIALWLPETAAQ